MSDLPDGWHRSTLGEVTRVLDSRRIPLNARERAIRPGPFPYYGANGQVGTIDGFLFEGDHILLAEDGGYFDDPDRPNAYPVNGRFWVNNHAHILKATEAVDQRFLLHSLNATDLMPYVNGTTRMKLTQADMRRIPVPIPPLAEQRRIVARIEALFARTRRARADLERIAPLSKRFRKCLLTTQLNAENKSWPILTVAEVSDNHDGRRVPIKESDRAKRRGPFPYFGASGQIVTIDAFLFDGRYILVSEDGANLLARSTAIAFQAAGRFWVNNHAHVLTAKPGVIQDFLEYAIEAHDLTSVVTGSAQPKLTQRALNALSVPVPPIDEQARAISTIQRGHLATRTAELDASRALALLDRLEESILARAFRGELVPQDPAEAVDALASAARGQEAATTHRRRKHARAA